MAAREVHVPTTAELQAFCLGKLDPHRESEVELYLAEHPECSAILEATPDDEVVRPLRGAGALPEPAARSPLLQLAVEAVIPVLGGCAGALAGGPEGGLVGVAAGQAAEKAINFFGARIVNKWLEWLRGKPRATRAAVLEQLAEVLPEVARSEVRAALEQQAGQGSSADRQAASDYLSAIPGSVRRSLLSERGRGGRTLPPAISLDDPFSLLQLLPTDLPPYPAPSALPGTDYRLEELIGSGGFGAVYRASGSSLQHLPLAIKFCLDRALVPALQQERANLERLMKAGGESWSPRLVRLYGYDLEHRTPYLVYEYVSGGDLARWLAARQAKGDELMPGEVLELIVQVAEALAFAHERGLVHRDLKPANVLMADGTIKLADFGIGGLVARQAVQASRIGTGAVSRLSPAEQASLFRGAGTPLYMSKEQREGKAPDPRHDLYSLGVLWYQLLIGDVTGELHPGWADELLEDHAVPPEHVELLRTCVGVLKKRPEHAGQLLELLRQKTAAPLREAAPARQKPAAKRAESGDPATDTIVLREGVARAVVAVRQAKALDWRFGVGLAGVLVGGLFGLAALIFFILLLAAPSDAGPGVRYLDTDHAVTSRQVFGVLLSVYASLSLPSAVLGVLLGKARLARQRQARQDLLEAIASAQAGLSLPAIPFDRGNNETLCQAGWALVRAIEERHQLRSTSARVRVIGWGTEMNLKVLLDGELLGEGTQKEDFDLPVQLCRGTHYLEMRGKVMLWSNIKKEGSFYVAREGDCLVEVKIGGRTSVDVFWPHSA
jgi:hypothetical protein